MPFLQQFPGINALYYQYSEYREKKKEYYKSRSDIKSYNHFLKRINDRENNINSFNSPIRIKPFGLNFGVSKQDTVLELGKPDYVLVETGLRNHQIIFYKKRSLNHSHLLQVHFVNNKMVYAMNRIRDISPTRKVFFAKITSMLFSKYSVNYSDKLNLIDAEICDDFNGRIEVSETVGLNIRYVSGSNDFVGFINSRIDKKKIKKEYAEISNLDNIFMHI